MAKNTTLEELEAHIGHELDADEFRVFNTARHLPVDILAEMIQRHTATQVAIVLRDVFAEMRREAHGPEFVKLVCDKLTEAGYSTLTNDMTRVLNKAHNLDIYEQRAKENMKG